MWFSFSVASIIRLSSTFPYIHIPSAASLLKFQLPEISKKSYRFYLVSTLSARYPVHCRGVRKSNLHFNRGNGEWSVAAARAPWRAEQSPPIMSDTSLIERHGYATACQRKTRFIILCWSHACDLWRHCFFFCLFVWTCFFILDSEVRI